MLSSPRLEIGAKVNYDGTLFTVVGFDGATVLVRSDKGHSSRLSISALFGAADFQVSGVGTHPSEPAFPDLLSPELHQEATQLLAHLREAETGYRSGTADDALSSEPKPEYDPMATSYSSRMRSKAEELGLAERTLWKKQKAFDRQGITGLVDGRRLKEPNPLGTLDPRVRQAILDVLNELTNKSNHTKDHIRRLVQIRLDGEYGEGEVSCPKRTAFNTALNELARGKEYWGSAKRRRNAANRPETPYRRFSATRPGEFVLIDSTPLDAFGIEPVNFRWVSLQLTIAFDLFSRSIIAWRFTPRDASRVDAALLLYDIITPTPMRPEWPESSKFSRRYVGVPEHLIVEVGAEDAAAVPIVNPETVVVDRGKIFVSQAFQDACARLGINIHLSRPKRPTDKSQVERAFETISESFVAMLPSYKGPDVYSRGDKVEDDAFFFVDEIEELFAEWVATYWQPRHHQGIAFDAAPKLNLSPNEMYEEGISRAGFIFAPPDRTLYYDLLPTEWRTIQTYGVEVRSLRYDGEVLNYYRSQTSPYGGEKKGRWPLRYDPRDLSQVFFYDTALREWHPLYWVGASNPNTPFNESTLTYAKALLTERGGNTHNHDELESVLKGLMVRIGDRQLHSKEERRLAARQAIQASQAARDRGRGSFSGDNLVSIESVKREKELRPPDAPAGILGFDFLPPTMGRLARFIGE